MDKQLKYSVLLCEDDPINREAAFRILSRRFEKVYIAQNGIEAFNIFNWHKIDVVVTDITMPEIDGLTLVRDIRAKNRHIPVVIMSAHDEKEYFLQAIDSGVNQYVIKPIVASKLIRAVHKVLGIIDHEGLE